MASASRMAWSSPTMRTSASRVAWLGRRKGSGAPLMARSSPRRRLRASLAPCRARRGGTAEAIVDGFAEALIRDRHHRDGARAERVELAERGEEICRGLAKIAARAEIDHRTERRRIGPEREQRFALAGRRGVKAKRRLRRVMHLHLSRRHQSSAGFRQRHGMPQDLLDLLARERAGTKQGDGVAVNAEHGRFKAEGACAAVEDHGRKIAELRRDMGGRGWAHALRAVGARRRDRDVRGLKQGARDRVARRAERHGVGAGANEVGNGAIGAARQHERQRSRPEGAHQFSRRIVDDRIGLGLGHSRHMHDQRVEAWPRLGREHLGHGGRIECIGAEAIDRLGGKRDDLAPRQGLRGAGNRLVSGGNDRHGVNQSLVQRTLWCHFAC